MKKGNLVSIISLCLIILLVPAAVLPADNGEGMLSEEDLARVRKKVEALRIWQLTEELDLDPETSAKLFPAMKEANDSRWRIESENRALIREINRLMKEETPDPHRLNSVLDQMQSNQMELARIEDRHITRVRAILSPEDFVHYLMFQIRFQRELREKAAMAFREGRNVSTERTEPGGSGGSRSEAGVGEGSSDGGSGGGRR